MKKFVLIVLTIITASILAFSLVACGNNVPTDKLLRLNFCNNDFVETFVYSVSGKVGDSVVNGTLTFKISPSDGGYVIERTQEMDDGTKFFGRVKFSKSGSFLPSESLLTTEKNGEKSTEKIVYDGKKLRFFVAKGDSIPVETPATEHEIASPYYDNMQFYTIIRGATFAKKFNLAFNTFAPRENRVVKLQCSLGSTENKKYTVSGNEGAVDCQAVYVALTSAPVTTNQAFRAYYAKSDIELANQYKLKQVLVEFVENGFTYTLKDASATSAS